MDFSAEPASREFTGYCESQEPQAAEKPVKMISFPLDPAFTDPHGLEEAFAIAKSSVICTHQEGVPGEDSAIKVNQLAHRLYRRKQGMRASGLGDYPVFDGIHDQARHGFRASFGLKLVPDRFNRPGADIDHIRYFLGCLFLAHQFEDG